MPYGYRFNRVWVGGPTDGRSVLALQQWGEWQVKRGVWPFRWTTGEKFWATHEVGDYFDTDREASAKLTQTAWIMQRESEVSTPHP